MTTLPTPPATLVLPLDGSALAERALPFGVRLARGAGAALRLVRVIPGGNTHNAAADGDAGPLGPDQQPTAPDAARAEESLAAIVVRLREGGAEAAAAVRHGDAARAIADEARAYAGSLIVMSTHGWGGLQRWLYGSVADRVLRQAGAPVLLLPAACRAAWPDGPTGPVLVPLDGSPLAEEALEPAARVARLLGAGLLLLQVVEPSPDASPPADAPTGRFATLLDAEEAARAAAEAYLARVAAGPDLAGCVAVTRVVGGEYPPAAIASAARAAGAALIAMSTHGRSGIARLVMGSVATETIQLAEVPLLLVRPAAVRELRATTGSAATTAGSELNADRPLRLSLTPGEIGLLRRGLERLLQDSCAPLEAADSASVQRLNASLRRARGSALSVDAASINSPPPAPIVDGVRGPDDLDPIFIPERLRARTG